jgi:hypothetical protein
VPRPADTGLAAAAGAPAGSGRPSVPGMSLSTLRK